MSNELDKKRIEELEQEIEILKALVVFDSLTGLYTRSGFSEEVLPFFHEMEYSQEHPDQRRKLKIEALSLLFIDIDDFKEINDTKGHMAGDKILRKTAETIERNVRGSDFVGRWGGEEIVVALLGADEAEGAEIAEKIRSEVEKNTGTTVSIGAAEFTGDVKSLNNLIERADKAMYRAKDGGKNRVVTYSEL